VELLVASTAGVAGLADHEVGPLTASSGCAEVWAIVDGREVWRGPEPWLHQASWDGARLTCLAPVGDGEVFVGTAEAHLLRLDSGHLQPVASFDDWPPRAQWYTPWGGPPDTRSLAAAGNEPLVNVHVGGVARGSDRGWEALVDIDVDVHQIAVAPDGSLLVATGAAGFGRSTDGGRTWQWDATGLHGSYCRAVAVAGDQVLLTASTGPSQTRGAVYRRTLGESGPWTRTGPMVDGNIDTFWLAAAGDEAAFAAADGRVWISSDAGATWVEAGPAAGSPRGLAFVA
jgi:hypothetical protein